MPDGAYEWALDIQKNNPTVVKTNVGGYQSPDTCDWTNMKYFQHIKKALRFLPAFEFSNWWLNINKKGDYNHWHSHPGCELSGIWYITKNYKSLVFHHPLLHLRAPLLQSMNEPLSLMFECEAGSLLIFPSDLVHCVNEHVEEASRISVSFNIFLPKEKAYVNS